MKLHSYLGGIALRPYKEQSKNCEIISIVPEDDMVYPLIPCEGKCPLAYVKAGDKVKIGQQIAGASDGTLGIYSSVSGIVKAVAKKKNYDMKIYDSIIIENDGEFEEGEFDEVVDIEQLSFIQIVNLLGAYGIREYIRGGFSLYEKLKRIGENNANYVIINGVECEPYLTSIYRRFIDDSDMIFDGVRVMKHLFPKSVIIIAIGDDNKEAVAIMEKKIKNEPNVEVEIIPNLYPSGDCCRLIYQISGKAFENEIQALSDGIICINVDTLCAVSNAVFEGLPPMSRVITLSGEGCVNPGNYEVLFGTSIEEVIRFTGGQNEDAYITVAGGPLTGIELTDLNVPVTSSLESILILSKRETENYEPEECIRCSRCAAVCPNRLIPEKLFYYAKKGNYGKFLKWHGDSCSMCGCCSYVCPSHIPLTDYITYMRDSLGEF